MDTTGINEDDIQNTETDKTLESLKKVVYGAIASLTLQIPQL